MSQSFLSSRLSGSVPLETVFWRDMLAVGTVINVSATAAALGLFAGGFPPVLGLIVNFLPLPWNVFLLVSVWKAAEREGGTSARTANIVAAVWFLVMVAM